MFPYPKKIPRSTHHEAPWPLQSNAEHAALQDIQGPTTGQERLIRLLNAHRLRAQGRFLPLNVSCVFGPRVFVSGPDPHTHLRTILTEATSSSMHKRGLPYYGLYIRPVPGHILHHPRAENGASTCSCSRRGGAVLPFSLPTSKKVSSLGCP